MGKHASYRVTHETSYVYAAKATSAHQLAHLQPRNTPWQKVRYHRLDIEPQPTERWEGIDYFGNALVRFMIDTPHESLRVTAESVVDVETHAPDPAAASPPWEDALAAAVVMDPQVDLDLEQYRLASPMVPELPESGAYALESFTPGRPWLEAALDLTRRIHAEYRYDPKATTVTTHVSEVLEHKSGVCQDFAHLMLSCLRSLGLPARYVSGYVLNYVPEGKARLTGADASHAWVAAHCPGLGWVAFDPTNGKLADLEFVTLGWGREFSDISPLSGVVLGGATQQLSVVVDMRPVTNDDPPARDAVA